MKEEADHKKINNYCKEERCVYTDGIWMPVSEIKVLNCRLNINRVAER